MVGSELPEHLLAHLHVVVRHVEHMTCGMKQEDSGDKSKGPRTGRSYKRRGEKQENPAMVLKLATVTYPLSSL